MVDIITGYRTTKNVLADRRVLDFSKTIAMLNPNRTPFIVLTQKIAKQKTVNPEFYWIQDEYMPKFDRINCAAGYAAGILSVVVDNVGYFPINCCVKVTRTGEVFRVTARTIATSTLTIARSVGTTAAAALVDNDELIIMASAYAEGATSGIPAGTKAVKDYNYLQIMRTPFSATRTNEQSEMYGGPDRATQRKKMGVEHEELIENLFFFGERYEDNTGAEPLRYTGGVYEYLNSNITNVAGGILTEPVWEQWLRDNLFLNGSDNKIVVCSPIILSVLSMWGAAKVTKKETDKSLGIAISEYISPHGKVNLVSSKTLKGDVYGGDAVGLDFDDDCVKFRFLQDTILKTNIQAADADGWKDEYLTECGLQFKQKARHAILSGVLG